MFGPSFNTQNESQPGRRYMAWIDGVGAWLILTGEKVSVGRVTGGMGLLAKSGDEDEADLALMANMSRRHASLERVEEDYLITPHSRVSVYGRPVDRQTVLPNDCEVTLGDSVRIGFSVPTPLSASARLTFQSNHRPRTSVDGVVLMADTCLLGNGPENHICCPSWSTSVVLARTKHGLAARSREPLFVDGKLAQGLAAVESGQVITTGQYRFRLEALN